MNDEIHAELERLQDIIREETGRKVPTEELLETLVAQALESPHGLIDAFIDPRVPVSDAEKAAFNAGRSASGNATREADIDTITYERDVPESTGTRN